MEFVKTSQKEEGIFKKQFSKKKIEIKRKVFQYFPVLGNKLQLMFRKKTMGSVAALG